MKDGKQAKTANLLSKLTPKQRRLALVGGAAVVIIGGFVLLSSGNPRQVESDNARQNAVADIITSANTRNLGLDGLNERTSRLSKDVDKIDKSLDNLTKLVKKNGTQSVTPSGLKDILAKHDTKRNQYIATQLNGLRQKYAHLAQATPPPASKKSTSPSNGTHDQVTSKMWQGPQDVAHISAQDQGGAHGQSTESSLTTPSDATSTIKIREIGAESTKAGTGTKGAQGKDTGVFLPAGSMISGVLLTGMDAPTNTAAKSQPYPALIRVKKDAILPNRYRLDVRECFIVASGYGSLSSERVYLRSQVLSCVRNDGGVIEVPLKAYATGKDGKVGLRGPVVSKQGQFLAKSLMAGFASSASQIFNRVQVPTLNTTDTSQPLYQNVLTSDSLTAGVVRGAGKALDRLAQFYLKMAQDIYPVIELNSNTPVTFIVTQGGELKTVDGDKN